MKYYIRTNHAINKMDGRPIEKKILFWIKSWSLEPTNYVCIAIDDGKVVAFMRFDKFKENMQAAGTWVDKSYRGNGIAKKLWKKVLTYAMPKSVKVVTTTRGGNSLVKSLIVENPKIKFYHKCRIYWK